MKVTVVIALLFFCVTTTRGQVDDTLPITVTASVVEYTPVCTIDSVERLAFGSIYRPATGSGSMTINVDNGSLAFENTESAIVSRVGLDNAGGDSPTYGAAKISALHADQITGTIAYPPSLTSSEGQIDFTGSAALKPVQSFAWTPITSGMINEEGPGRGAESLYDLRIGGRVSGITLHETPLGEYSGTITISVACL